MNSAMTKEPLLSVGIHDAPRLLATLEGSFLVQDNGRSISGPASVKPEGDGLVLQTEIGVNVNGRDITIMPADPSAATFVLHDVVIGRQFHWQRAENQSFRGGLRLLRTGTTATAINVVGVEDYLTSVISSEMSPEGSLEFLKAHAITSRSWLLAQLEQSRALKVGTRTRVPSTTQSPGRLIRWYDREEHDRFDVCADDHCQRYQGMTSDLLPPVAEAVRQPADSS